VQPDVEQAEPGAPSRGKALPLAAFWLAAGINHFVSPRFYEVMMPPPLRSRASLVNQASGVAEIAGGIAVLLPRTRRLAGPYLVAVLAAVFPANIYMATDPERFKKFPSWALWARLPLQPLMMVWAWKATRR